ncbi:universal stress protein [candidate division KSB1 bacterium]|nr:universal stress protein [candidate division KSB1 bacterium]RQW10768.1 MAG: universal stress protein [candidate division KSB1 bacterium]
MEIKNILVPSDFSDTARHALANALAIAAMHQARITLLHVVTVYDDDPYNPSQTFPDLDDYYDHLEERAGAQFAETISRNELKHIPIEYVIRRGFSPHEEILTYLSEKEIDFIALGTHSRKPLARFFLGSVAENIVHHASCPVLTVRIDDGDARVPVYKNILVPTDFSEQSKRALTLATSLLQPDGALYVLHVVEEALQPAYFTVEGDAILQIMPKIRERSQAMLDDMIKECVPATVRAEALVKEGRISTTIVEFAEEKQCDLIAMGTHGMNALGQIIIGSQANRVIRKAACPVVTIK